MSTEERLQPTPQRFGFTMGAALLLVAIVMVWRGSTRPAQVTAAAGALLIVTAATIPRALAPVARAWMAFGHALGRVTTPVLFTLLWLFAFVPMGVLRRTFSRSPLERDRDASTYWVRRPPTSDDVARSAMERQF